MSESKAASVVAPPPGPLLLQVGDPLPPPATVGGSLQVEALAGRYAVLLAGVDRSALPAIDAALATLGDKALGRLRCHVLMSGGPASTAPPAASGQPTGHVDVHVDEDDVTARRWGALTGQATRTPVAIVLEPRGRVQACVSAPAAEQALLDALRAASLLG